MIPQIEVQELNKLNREEITVVDIRTAADFARGTVEGAVNIPLAQLFDRMDEIPADKPVYLLSHTGKHSEPAVRRMLEGRGEVYNIAGGFRAYLASKLLPVLEKTDEEMHESVREIERSIIKKFRKPIWRQFTRAITDYSLIHEGDKIACCISGGKDSMLLAKLLQELQRHGQVHFDLVFLCMDPGYHKENMDIIRCNAKKLGIPLTVFQSDIFDSVVDIEKNPCYLCARMRRGFLYSHAQALGCNKIALGHHFDDVVETILMGMLYGGKIETMMPKLHSTNFEGMELIRPMYMIKEADVCAWRDYHDLHFLQCACRFTENNAAESEEHTSKRDEMSRLIEQFRQIDPNIEKNIFASVHNVNLKTIIGYHKGDDAYNFLDDYDERTN